MSKARMLSIVALAVSAFSLTARAHAESDADLERAKALFEDARKLMAEGKYDPACSLLEQSLAKARGIGTRYNLADCEEHREHFVRAQELFLEVAQLAREAGQSDRERVARERAANIEAKLSRLKLELDEPVAELELDDRKLAEGAARESVAVTPGKHRVTARAPGKKPWAKQIDVPTPGLFVIVSVPALTNLGPEEPHSASEDAAQAQPAPAKPARVALPSDAPQPSPNRARDARRAALVVAGVGLGASVAGVAFGLQYLSNNHDAKGVCPTSYGCSADEISQHAKFIDDARTARTWSYVGFGVGAAALTGAAILYTTAGHTGDVSATTGVNADGAFNVAVRGRF